MLTVTKSMVNLDKKGKILLVGYCKEITLILIVTNKYQTLLYGKVYSIIYYFTQSNAKKLTKITINLHKKIKI